MKRKTLFSLLSVSGLTLALGVLLVEISTTVNAQGAKPPGETGVQVVLDTAFTYRNPSTPTNGLFTPRSISVYTCPLTSTNQYGAGIVYQFDIDDPVRPAYNHPDKNLELRGYTANTEPDLERGLVDYGSDDPTQPPQLATLFDPYRVPALSNFYRVHNWNWAPSPEPGTRGDPITTWPVTALGMETTPGETLHVPDSGYDIGGGVEVIVLFADEDTVALRYTRQDSSAPPGYTVHIDNICTDSNLLTLYNSLDDPGGARYTYVPPGGRPYGYDLPALAAGHPLGTARDTEIVVAIVDTGAFVDTRSRNEWWQIRPEPPPTEPPDTYEPDDTCVQANAIPVGGTVQIHSFHHEGDEDWVSFEATSGITHVVEVRVPPTSTADVALEIYNICDAGTSSAGSDPTFSPDIRLTFQPPDSGIYYLKLSNTPTTTYGSDVVYHLSVRALENNQPSGAVILVAGRLKSDDELQANIHNVTNRVYQFALAHGCTTDDIRYLATEAMTGVVGLPTKANLEDAITNWAAGRVGPDQPLTVYLMDHGTYDLLYLDKPSGEWITPGDLDGWLDSLGTEVPVNVVVEACYSGSFIDLAQTVSGPGRVVIASTSNAAVAYATQEGAKFSDVFLESLGQGTSLHSAFEEGNWAARQGHSDQQPWLDDDGDGIANEAEDGEVAALRSLACETLVPAENWPPYILAVEVGELSDCTGEIRARVQDDGEVAGVWMVIYPPSYTAPISGEEMIEEPTPLVLEEHPTEEEWYTLVYTGFDEPGEYRLVVYAEDNEAAQGRPKEMTVQTGWPVYLPLVVRSY